MKRTLVKFKNSTFSQYIEKHQKYAPIIFFIGGFIFDTLTLGRIDRTYDLTVLCLHMTALSITLYLYNLADDGKWKNTFLERFERYFPLAIQFFFGGLSSAYVIYFSRSVSLSKTAAFFIILLALLLANEFLKKRISNKYLQFSIYFFINFTFFVFMIPVFTKQMNTKMFIISGLVSFISTLTLITFIYFRSPSTRLELHLGKLSGLILGIYAFINVFYYFNLIPPVPLALQTGLVAHNVVKANNKYHVTYERDDSFLFWRDHRPEFIYQANEPVYVYTSIFAPTALKKGVMHRWEWYNSETRNWEIKDTIPYAITGGRNAGFRGYTYKNNILPGKWRVEVITEEELLLGVIDFEIITNPDLKPKRLIEKVF